MRRTAYIVACVMAVLISGTAVDIIAQAQKQAAKSKPKDENFHRPKPSRPIKPEIPSANRQRTDKVFLEYADSLYTLPLYISQPDLQIVKGNVKFRQGGMFMYCDSAYYYPESDSMDAFGNVRMEQGDTLFVYADKLFFDGPSQLATLKSGPSRNEVRLVNRNTTLVTDSLDYNLDLETGWYKTGGTIDDKVNTLTSITGEYCLKTKDARFTGYSMGDVLLVNNDNGSRMLSTQLDYNTDSHIASISTPTRIESANDTIITRQGWYDTTNDNAELLSRSIILHSDSTGNVTTLEGDSIIYDKASRISRAYMFRDPFKSPLPMVLTDTANKMILKGGYGEYNDSTKTAFSTGYPLLIEHSRPDSLFLRADTIRTFIERRLVFPELTPEQLAARDSLTLLRNDSLLLVTSDTITLEEGVTPPAPDSIPVRPGGMITMERDSSEMVEKEFHVAQAYHRARFFRNDLQGVADSIAFVEFDSLLYMYKKPVVWSDNRQVFGGQINVHFNDSTADWAYLPDNGFVAELVDEDFYNQLSGKTMKAFFEQQELKHLDVEGNVMAIILPQENDSTFNKLINAESSFLSMDLDDKKMEKLKMWPAVNGTVTPIFLVKNQQKYLPGFLWLDAIRPRRVWYDERWKWEDDLGEIPEELELYFNQQ